MNYTIIKDTQELLKFINWLPDLEEDECFYVALFSRSKYHSSKLQGKLSEFTANKSDLFYKIKRLEIERGSYLIDEKIVYQDSLALYISINPRSIFKASKELIQSLIDRICNKDPKIKSLNEECFSAIQKSIGRKIFVEFDIDNISLNNIAKLEGKINTDSFSVIVTKGGYHLLINPLLIHDEFKTNWYKNIINVLNPDVVKDMICPVPGCVQGDFSPVLLTDYNIIKNYER